MNFISSWRTGLYTFYAYGERSLDLPGYIPWVSSYTAPLRAKLALVQLIHSVVLGLLLLVAKCELYFFKQQSKVFQIFTPQILQEDALQIAKNSLSNLIRSAIESLTFVNILLFSFDLQKSRSNPLIFQQFPTILEPTLHRPLAFWQRPSAQEPLPG